MYNQAYMTALLSAQMMFGKGQITSFEEMFGLEEQPVNNDVLREMWLDYASVWNKKRKEGK